MFLEARARYILSWGASLVEGRERAKIVGDHGHSRGGRRYGEFNLDLGLDHCSA